MSPDGQTIAFVVSTIDLGENTTINRIWLAGPAGEPAPVTNGPHDAGPAWSPDGRWLAFASRRGEKEHESTLHVLPVDGPGEVRTIATMPDGISDLTWSPDGKWLGYTSRTRDPRYEAKDERWQAPRKIETFFTRLDDVGWICDRPHARVRRRRRRHEPAAQPHARARSSTAASRGSPTRPASSPSAGRHDTWDRDLCEDLYLVPLDGDIRPLTKQTGIYGNPSVSPDGTRIAFLGADDPNTYPQNVKVGVIDVTGGQHRWISTELDRTLRPVPRPAAADLARRQHPARQRRGPRARPTSTASPPTVRRRRSG